MSPVQLGGLRGDSGPPLANLDPPTMRRCSEDDEGRRGQERPARCKRLCCNGGSSRTEDHYAQDRAADKTLEKQRAQRAQILDFPVLHYTRISVTRSV